MELASKKMEEKQKWECERKKSEKESRKKTCGSIVTYGELIGY